MLTLRTDLPQKMEDMRVEVNLLTFPLLSEEHPEFTMFPAVTTSPLILLLHIPQPPASQITSMYNANCHLVVLIMMIVQQFPVHLITALHFCKIPQVLHSQQSPSTPYVMTLKKNKKIFKQLH